MGVFEGMLLMRVTTVASVTEKNDFFQQNRRNQLLRTVFDSYVLFYPTVHPHNLSATLLINNKQRNAVSDAYEAPPQIATSSTKAATTRRILSLRPHLRDITLSQPLSYTPYQ